MEVALAPAQPDGLQAAFGPKEPCGFGDRRFSSPSCLLTNGDDLFHGYSSPSSPFGLASVISTPSPRAASLSHGSSVAGSVVDEGDDAAADAAAAEDRPHRLARLAHQYQEVVSRFELCLSYLADASNEAAALRRENDELRVTNEDLARRIKMVRGKLVDEFSGLSLAECPTAPLRPLSPLLVTPALPRSISVRSPGYLKMNQKGKHRTSRRGSQRMFVGMDGSVKGEGEHKDGEEEKLNSGLEFEVYSQGMLKTELCNKWEETGACPYGDQCQFAHGITELRPVIRHPRYKTQVCRMLLAGAGCPYGHRCHFLHSITPADLFPLHA
ncbi:unnamed protein product [Urochloa humidicola]